jgi:signal transduction histidine kinase
VVVTSGHVVIRAVSREMRVARLKSDFVAAVSHEFRTPLTTIRQLSELLARSRVSTDDRKQQFYDAILSESERLQRLVENLLDFGRIEAGRLTYTLMPIDLEPLVTEVAGHVARTAASSGHRIEVHATAPVPPIRGDRDALSHAIRNLLDNAVKYSPAHEVVELSLAGNHRTVSIQVRDRGLGIPQAEQQDIFETFVRGTSPGVRRVAGTGVGLAMARQIVEAHRGSISVESAPGKGSTFTVCDTTRSAASPTTIACASGANAGVPPVIASRSRAMSAATTMASASRRR